MTWTGYRFPLLVFSILVLAPGLSGRVTAQDAAKQTAASWIDAHEKLITQVGDQIWQNPEPGFEEFKTSELLTKELEKAGFKVERGVGGMPTAFVATYGSGKPVIALIPELDAMPGLSQKAVPYREPVTPGGVGHACQHHLVAASGLGSALALREAIEKHKIPGTVMVVGAPAEEELIGKVYLVKSGLFKDVDAALSWHPGTNNEARYGFNSALLSVKFSFTDLAKGSNDEGSLPVMKAADIFEHALDLMRNQMPDKSTISHPVYTKQADRPNIPPSVMEMWYYIRSPDIELSKQYFKRMTDTANAAASAMGVKGAGELVIGTHQRLTNEALVILNDKNMRLYGPPKFTAEDQEFARKIAAAYAKENPGVKVPDKLLADTIDTPSKRHAMSSNDNGDISWVTPFSSIQGGSRIAVDPSHNWVTTATGGTGIGRAVEMLMAKTLAGVAIDLMTKPEELKKVRAEFEEKAKGLTYEPYVPENPPIRVKSGHTMP